MLGIGIKPKRHQCAVCKADLLPFEDREEDLAQMNADFNTALTEKDTKIVCQECYDEAMKQRHFNG